MFSLHWIGEILHAGAAPAHLICRLGGYTGSEICQLLTTCNKCTKHQFIYMYIQL